MIKAFPKIFAIGQSCISDIFKSEVEITEKIDGSQFNFGKVDGELYLRSKNVQIYPENPDNMFRKAVDYVLSIEDKIENNTVYYSEYLMKPNHGALKYERTPLNKLILFGVSNNIDQFNNSYESIKKQSNEIGIECVPLLFRGVIENPQALLKMLEIKSVLGNVSIEGIVIKNYSQPFLIGNVLIPIMMGKYVSEKYKEVQKTGWKKYRTHKGKFELLKESFRTEARWNKAIQHLRDSGELENAPRDIGKLIKEIQNDITEEEKENIKEFLWNEYSKEILGYAIKGFPEFYKEYLLKENF